MGGPLAVTNTVEAALVAKTGVSVLRVAGKDYTGTAAQLARFEAAGSTDGLGWTPRTMCHAGTRERVHRRPRGRGARKLAHHRDRRVLYDAATTPHAVSDGGRHVPDHILDGTGHSEIDGTAGKSVAALTILGGSLAVSTATIAAIETALSH